MIHPVDLLLTGCFFVGSVVVGNENIGDVDMCSITENEFKVMNAISDNYFGDGTVDFVWCDSINDSNSPSGLSGKSLSGVVSSLSTKELVETDGSVIRLTKKGANSLSKKSCN